MKGSDVWHESTVISRGGKASGKNWAYLNIQVVGEEQPKGVYFDKDVEEWESLEVVNSASVTDKVEEAKLTELRNWCTFKVYDEVQDMEQMRMSTRWVITEKLADGQKSVKARLVARGFEENTEVGSNSPTANKESLRIFLAITSTTGWKTRAIDIKAAFLQGEKINRMIFLQPPKEARTDNKLWLLKKCCLFKKLMLIEQCPGPSS